MLKRRFKAYKNSRPALRLSSRFQHLWSPSFWGSIEMIKDLIDELTLYNFIAEEASLDSISRSPKSQFRRQIFIGIIP